MKALDAVLKMIKDAGTNPARVSAAIKRAPSYVGALINRGSTPQADTLAEIAQACGYRLILEGHGEQIEIEP